MTLCHLGGRTLLLVVGGVGFAVFVALAAIFWIGTNTGEDAAAPEWARTVGALGGWKVLPAAVVTVCAALALVGRWSEARFVLLSVVGAGALMYAARVVLQAAGADDDGGQLSDYPSGHAVAVTSFAAALSALVWSLSSRTSLRALAFSLAGAVAVTVGVARVAGGEHTVLDVVGGVALGLGWASLSFAVAPPTRPSPLERRQVLAASLALGLAGFMLLAVLHAREPVDTLDLELAERVAETMPGWVQDLARPLSWLGGWIGLTALGVAAGVLLVRERAWLDLVFFVTAFAGSQLVVALLKEGFDRPRPHVGSAVPLPESAAFPSGHATAGAAALGALTVLVTERVTSARARAWLWSAALALGVGVGLSRVVLNVHYATDVLAGFSLGVAWLAACLLARDALRARAARRRPGLPLPSPRGGDDAEPGSAARGDRGPARLGP